MKTPKKTCGYRRLHPISDKRREALKEYNKVAAKYLDEHPICEYEELGEMYGKEFPIPCFHKSTQIHHTKGRGKYLCDTRFFKAVCNTHGGSYIHDRSGDSYARGFMLPRWK